MNCESSPDDRMTCKVERDVVGGDHQAFTRTVRYIVRKHVWPRLIDRLAFLDLDRSPFSLVLCLRATPRHEDLRRSRLFGQFPGRNKLKVGSRLLVSSFPEINSIPSCCGVL